jgi:hypothetical protein
LSSAMVRSFSANTSVLMTFTCCCTDAHAGQAKGEAEDHTMNSGGQA